MINITILVFIMITILFILLTLLHTYEHYRTYLDYKSRCFDCEADMIARYGPDGAWMANPSKSYASEQQGVDMYGLPGGFIGKTIKYY